MRNESQIDHSTLNWVKQEIDETLNQARQALEDYVDNPDDATQLRFSFTHIHQVYGTLQMVELYGAALLAEEMERVTQALIDEVITQKEDAYEVLMRAMLQLPDYLERIQSGLKDDALILLPLLNDLRAARSADLLSENAFFAPDITKAKPIVINDKPADVAHIDVRKLAKKLRPIYQVGLLAWLRNRNPKGGLSKIQTVLKRLEQTSTREDLIRLWWVTNGLIEALIDDGVEVGLAVKKILGQVDREIKAVIDNGEVASQGATQTLRNLLYYIARSTSQGERVQDVKNTFNLKELITSDEEIASARESIAGPNVQLMETVLSAVREDLSRVKEALDMFLRSENPDIDELSPHAETLTKLADTLGMLSLGAPRKVVLEQVTTIEKILAGTLDASEDRLMSIAGSLLVAESSLDGFIESRGAKGIQVETKVHEPGIDGLAGGSASEDADPMIPESEFAQIQGTVLREIGISIARAKDAIVSFIEAPMDFELLEEAPRLFAQAQGGMKMISLDEAASLMGKVIHYINEELLRDHTEPTQQGMDNLADAIASIEYYLEAIRENRPRKGFILKLAKESLHRLGYEVLVGDEAGLEPEPSQPKPQVPDYTQTVPMAKAKPGSTTAVGSSVKASASPPPKPSTPVSRAPASSASPAASSAPPLVDELDDEILGIFVEEAEEELSVIHEQLPKWKNNHGDQEALTRVRRSFHTLKGSGRMVGAALIGEFAWSFENMLNRVLDATITVSDEMFKLLDEAVDVLPKLIAQLQGGPDPQVDTWAIIDRAFSIVESEKAAVIQTDRDQQSMPEEKKEADEDEADSEPEPKLASVEETEPMDGVANQLGMMDATLVEIFSKESKGHIKDIHSFLNSCKNNPTNCLPTEVLVRALHTLHGSARMAESNPIAEIAGLLEKYAKLAMSNGSMIEDAGTEVLARSMVTIEALLAEINKPDAPVPDNSQLLADIDVLYKHELEIEQAPENQANAAVAEQNSGTENPADDNQEFSMDAETDGLSLDGLDLDMEFPDSDHPSLDEDLEPIQIALPQDKPEALQDAAADDDYDHELIEIFLEEGAEILDNSERIMQRWDPEASAQDVVESLQRELHTLKGGARMAGITDIGDLSHKVESLLTAIAEGQCKVSQTTIDVVRQAMDRLFHMLQNTRKRLPTQPADDLIEDLTALLEGREVTVRPQASGSMSDAAPAPTPKQETQETVDPETVKTETSVAKSADVVEFPKPPTVAPRTRQKQPKRRVQFPSVVDDEDDAAIAKVEELRSSGPQEMVRVRADLLDNLVNAAGEISIYRSRMEQQTGAFRFNLLELEQTVARLREQLRKMEIETEAQVLFRYEKEGDHDETFDPLEMDRYSQIQQLSRALMESTADISSIQGLLDNLTRESETLLLQQSRVNTDLQEGLMRTRMVSFSGLVPRMQRLVRQTASELGKKAELHIVGEHGEIDRTVLERITAPLEHMLRNAVSHGIEAPDTRKELDKPELGNISIALSREGSEAVLVISDDGAGMDLEAIRAKAKDRGLLDESSEFTDHDVMQLVLESGFSTAKEVTQISGRGVGMDVVNSEIKQLGGALHIDSKFKHGTTFTIRLPLTLALNHALLASVGEDVYAVPLSSVEGIVRLSADELVEHYNNPGSSYNYAGQEYQVHSLSAILGAGVVELPTGVNMLPVLLVRSGDHRTAIQVDRLMGSREIVVKSVGPQLSTVRGISGATILGDGRVVLILDMGAIIRLGVTTKLTIGVRTGGGEEVAAANKVTTIMVVDDSITVRKVTTRLLERNQMRVITAKDGVDAVAQLQDHIPDVMLLDIEMPRMDGFELATHMRNEPRLKNIPIIMITSRTGDKHRRRAEEIGVNQYLGKPYQETELLENIQALLRE